VIIDRPQFTIKAAFHRSRWIVGPRLIGFDSGGGGSEAISDVTCQRCLAAL